MDSNIRARTYSAQETADILGISKSTLLKAVRDGEATDLHPIRVKTVVRFPRIVVDQLAPEEAA